MKYNALVFFLLLSHMWLAADEKGKNVKYSRGKVFLQNGDAVNAYIKTDALYNMQSGIHCLDSTGNEYALLPSNAKGFCMMFKKDTMYFESRRDLKTVLFTSKKSKSSFIYRVSNGKLPLYYFLEKGLKMDGIDQVTVELPRYLILLDQEWFSLTKKYFVSDFKKLISNLKGVLNKQQMDELYNDVADKKFKYDNTPLVIEKLNKIPSFVN
jgi:hypothetical protein